jgi:putative IMPACT (imprinted ancient) family translation regulator
VAEAVKATGIAQKVLVSKFSFMYDLNEVGKILNILYQQQLFEIADVEYGLKAKVILKMKDSDKEAAEAWLTESLNKVVQLEREGSEFIEVPL